MLYNCLARAGGRLAVTACTAADAMVSGDGTADGSTSSSPESTSASVISSRMYGNPNRVYLSHTHTQRSRRMSVAPHAAPRHILQQVRTVSHTVHTDTALVASLPA